MQIEIKDLIGWQLDFAVAKYEGKELVHMNTADGLATCLWVKNGIEYEYMFVPRYSMDPRVGLPFVERNMFCAPQYESRFDTWLAEGQSPSEYGKQTFLVAATRCFVKSRAGGLNSVDIPDEFFFKGQLND